MNPGWRPKRVSAQLPGPKGAEFHRRAGRVLSAGVASHFISPVVQEGKRDFMLIDPDGNEFLDGVSAWGAEPYGVDREEVREAIFEVWRSQGMQISQAVPSEPALALAERLVALAPESITRVEFSVTGTQAVDSAVRLMREATGRPLILVFGPVYHGESTTTAAAASSDVAGVSDGATVFAPGIIHIPYPGLLDSPLTFNYSGGEEVITFLEEWVLQYQISPSQVAGILIEPIATEGGVTIPSKSFWDKLSMLVQKHDWLFCLDEVQTGMGRTGTVFAAERWGLQPDAILLGKGLSAGGLPISAILGSERLLGESELTLGSTFGWTPAACAGALAGIDILLNGETLPHIKVLEERANTILAPVRGLPGVTSTVGVGAEVGVTFDRNQDDGRTGADINNAVHARMLNAGVIGLSEASKRVYRLQPPLTIPIGKWEYMLHALREAVMDELFTG